MTYDTKAKALTARMKFQVYERKTFGGRGSRGGGGVQPRAIEIADVTGDGKNDVILLVHNRLNIYPQDK